MNPDEQNNMSMVDALNSLDHGNDDHWTKDGKPSLGVLEELTGGKYSRKEIDENYPQYLRSKDEDPEELPQEVNQEAEDGDADITSADYPEGYEQVVEDEEELANKVEELNDYVNDSDEFKNLRHNQQRLLQGQLKCMKEYLHWLRQRIKLYDEHA